MYKIYTIMKMKIIFVFVLNIDYQKTNRFLELKFNGYISTKMYDFDVIKTALEFQTIKVI